MSDLFETPPVRIGVALVVLCVLIAAGFYLVSIFRDYAAEDQDDSSDVLSKLEEMHRKGDISDAEYRTIQSRSHRPPVDSTADEDPTDMDESSPNTQT